MISDPDGEYFKSELGIKFVKIHHKSVPVGTSGLVKRLCTTCARLVKKTAFTDNSSSLESLVLQLSNNQNIGHFCSSTKIPS